MLTLFLYFPHETAVYVFFSLMDKIFSLTQQRRTAARPKRNKSLVSKSSHLSVYSRSGSLLLIFYLLRHQNIIYNFQFMLICSVLKECDFLSAFVAGDCMPIFVKLFEFFECFIMCSSVLVQHQCVVFASWTAEQETAHSNIHKCRCFFSHQLHHVGDNIAEE